MQWVVRAGPSEGPFEQGPQQRGGGSRAEVKRPVLGKGKRKPVASAVRTSPVLEEL